MRSHRVRWERSGVLLAVALVFGASACGGDDDDEGGTATSAPAAASSVPETSAAGGEAEQIAAGCAVDVDIERAFAGAPFPEGDAPTEAEIQAMRDYMTAEVGPLVTRAEELDIPDIEDDIETVIAPIRDFINTGNAAVFANEEEPAAAEADVAISKFFFDNCEGSKIEVSATDFAFSEPQGTLDVAPYRVKLTNDGKEAHEFVVLRKAEGVTETFDEILQLPEEQGQEKVAFVGGVEAIGPGEENYALVPIDEPGEYLAVCFIPVGATTVESARTTEGPPHFTAGMKIEFTAE